MALTEIPSELSSTPSIVDNGNSTAITIDSSENVGIGCTSISQPSSGATTLAIQGTSNDKAGAIRLYSANDSVSAYIYPDSVSGLSINTSTNHPIVFRTGNTEAMRLSGGNLLVGVTSTTIPGVGNTTAGVSIRGDDGSFFSRILGSGDTNNVLSVNRSTADGNILGFQKDGTTVGSIGTNAATMYVSAPQAGGMKYSYLTSTNAVMLPVTTTGASADGTHDLGLPGGRFRDIYLSGGVNFSVNANAAGMTSETLDDYEEGTWTPVIMSVGSGGNTATASMHNPTYTKVGRVVNVQVYINGININSLTGGTYITLQGFPFPCTNYADFTIAYKGGDFTSGNIIGGYIQSATSYAYFMRASGTEARQNQTDVTMTKAMINITYQAA